MFTVRYELHLFHYNSGCSRFVGAFAKLRKVTISFIISVCLSVRPSVCLIVRMKKTRLSLDQWFLTCGECSVHRFPGVRELIKNAKKESHYRPVQAHRVPEGRCSQISRQSAHEGGKVVSTTRRPPLPSRKYSWYSFLLEAESTPGP
jgi:hypothetical protein